MSVFRKQDTTDFFFNISANISGVICINASTPQNYEQKIESNHLSH